MYLVLEGVWCSYAHIKSGPFIPHPTVRLVFFHFPPPTSPSLFSFNPLPPCYTESKTLRSQIEHGANEQRH
jgi:hypothetical protein